MVGGVAKGALARSTLTFDRRRLRWRRVPAPKRREHLGVSALGGRVYAVAGREAGTNFDDVQAYAPGSRRWLSLPPVPEPRGGTDSAAVGRLLVSAGSESAAGTSAAVYAFVAGLATAIGAGVSMGFSEGLSDTGELTGRGNPLMRGTITGGGTFLGGILHTLPFLIPHYKVAIVLAIAVVGFELLVLAFLRWRYFEDSFVKALASVTLGGIIIAVVSAALGSAA